MTGLENLWELGLFVLAMLLAGVIAGFVAGLLGVGGGIVLVPVLFYILGAIGATEEYRMHIAVGTSLTTIVITAYFSAKTHYLKGSIDMALLKSWGPWLFVGAVGAMFAFGSIDTSMLTGIFGVVALLVALYMLFKRDAADPQQFGHFPGGLFRWASGLLVGAISSVMGIGGGTLSVPLLSFFKYPIRQAVGTAAAIGLVIAVPGAIGAFLSGLGKPDLPPFSLGFVNVIAFIILVPITGMVAPYGARAAHAIKPIYLRYAFVVFLLFNAYNMLSSAFA